MCSRVIPDRFAHHGVPARPSPTVRRGGWQVTSTASMSGVHRLIHTAAVPVPAHSAISIDGDTTTKVKRAGEIPTGQPARGAVDVEQQRHRRCSRGAKGQTETVAAIRHRPFRGRDQHRRDGMAGRPPFARRGEQGGRIATSGGPFFA